MKANRNRGALQNRGAWWLVSLAISGVASGAAISARAQENEAALPMAVQAREWRLDGTIVGLDARRGVLRLQPDVLVMSAGGDAVALGGARENATRLIATDAQTQMWTPDGQLRSLDFAALRTTIPIIAIGPLQTENNQATLRARLLMLGEGLPANYRAPQVLAAPAAPQQSPQQSPPQVSSPQKRSQMPAISPSAFKKAGQMATLAPANLSTPAERPPIPAPPQLSAPQTLPQVLGAPMPLRESAPPLPSTPPTLSTATSRIANLPQVLAPATVPPRHAALENRAVPPSEMPRALSGALLGAPDAHQPRLSRSENALAGRGALAAAPTLGSSVPNFADGRAVLRLDDAQNLWQQQQTANLARQNYAQLRALQSAVVWPTFSNGSGAEKIVALTFDDGPHPTGTPAVLAQLKRFGVPATFFVVGRNVEKHPELLQQTAAAGHDIANHSWHHFQGVKLSAEQWRQEISDTNRVIETVLGAAPRWFRAPGCHYSHEALSALRELGMVRADTSNNSGDWEGAAPEKIVARVLNRLAPGQVLLFHDSVPQTAQALPILLRELQARGYRCVTLSELAARAAQAPGFVPEFHPSGQGIVLPASALAQR